MSRSSSTSSVVGRDHTADEEASQFVTSRGASGLLSEQDLRALNQWTTIRTFEPRTPILRYGDPGRTVIVVAQGYVKLSTTHVNGREVMLEVLGPGGSVGEMAVLSKGSHEADVTTLSRCRLLSIDGRQFKQQLERKPDGLLPIMRLASERLRRARYQMADAFALSAPARLAKAILQLSSLETSSLDRNGSIRVQLSQRELGSMTGMTRESVNKHLGLWRDAGWILLSGGAVTLVNAEALAARVVQDDG
jgi:CRP-like cAMP-binding protein